MSHLKDKIHIVSLLKVKTQLCQIEKTGIPMEEKHFFSFSDGARTLADIFT